MYVHSKDFRKHIYYSQAYILIPLPYIYRSYLYCLLFLLTEDSLFSQLPKYNSPLFVIFFFYTLSLTQKRKISGLFTVTLPSRLIFIFIPDLFFHSAILCYFIFATILLVFARSTGIAVYVRDSLFNYIKRIPNCRYLGYFAMGKNLWQIDSDNGHLSNQQKESNCQSWVLLLHWNIFTKWAQYFHNHSISEKEEKENKEKAEKGGKESRMGKACPQTRETWSEFIYWMTNTDFILCYERLENITGNIQLLCRQYILMLPKCLSLYALY